ncbi:MAG: glycosyltransferase [Rhodospirillales bacterium]
MEDTQLRVMHIMAGAEYGGAEVFFVRLVTALGRAGLDQRAVIRTHARRAEALAQGGAAPEQLRFGGAFDFKTPRRLQAVADEYAPHIVMTWMNRASSMAPKGDWVTIGRQGGYYDLKYYKKCGHMIGNTQDIVDAMTAKGWPAERAHYVPNFVSADAPKPAPREKMFTPKGAPLVVALGRLHTNKAFDVLVRALAKLPNVYLWLAGEGPERAALERLAEETGVKPRVRFLGWREDADALLAAADIFVCPSRHEPLGNVVLEAWAQSTPVIAADATGPAALIEDGRTGLLVPMDDAAALSRAIRTLADDADQRARLGAAGRAAFEGQFTERAVVGRYLDLFQSLVS